MELIDSAQVYGQSYGLMYRCSNYPGCDAYVSCHQGTSTALGTPANRSLRVARKAAHRVFDRLWKTGGWRRSVAYARLREVLELPLERAHIAMLTEDECRALCRAVKRGDFKKGHFTGRYRQRR